MSRRATAATAMSSVLNRLRGAFAWPIHAVRNRTSSRPVVGSDPVVVSLTSHGRRVRRVHLTLESIGRGTVRPRRLILWLDDDALVADPPAPLRRLIRRGLEVRATEDFKPHKKYFPYVRESATHTLPLVTADDDVCYSTNWLERLWEAHRSDPDVVWCWRARRVTFDESGAMAAYGSWPTCTSTAPSHLNLPTGTSGVLYPPTMLDELHRRGPAFTAHALYTDDLWLHHVALELGVPAAQVTRSAVHFPVFPFQERVSLTRRNRRGGNDVVLGALYTSSDLLVLRRVADAEGPDPRG
jgi:hypothetical protein